jgi:hypothetical protein
MTKEELREIVAQLEAVESLTKLFKNLWFDQIRERVQDEKVRAYLMVFDDAFPAMNHAIEYVCRSAEHVNAGNISGVQKEFSHLIQNLLDKEVELEPALDGGDDDGELSADIFTEEPVMESELSDEERIALESVDQDDIDSLFTGGDEKSALTNDGADTDVESIDALFDTSDQVDSDAEDIEAFLSGEDDEDEDEDEDEEVEIEMEEEGQLEEEPELEAVEVTADDDDEIEDLIEEDSEAEEEDVDDDDLADLLGEDSEAEEEEEDVDDDDLADLLGEDSEAEEEEEIEDLIIEEEDLAGLLDSEESEEEEEGDLASLMDEDAQEEDDDLGELFDEEEEEGEMGAGISDEEMSALLDEGEDEKPKKPKKKAKAAKKKEPEPEEEELGQFSQDEIDALFG